MKDQTQTVISEVDQLYRKSYLRRVTLLIIVFGLLVAASLVAASVGTAKITIPDVFLSVVQAAAEKTAGLPLIGSILSLFGSPENGIAPVIVVNMRLPRYCWQSSPVSAWQWPARSCRERFVIPS